MTEEEILKKTKELKSKYQKEWRKAHPERKVWKPTPEKKREYNQRYWRKKAIAALEAEQQTNK